MYAEVKCMFPGFSGTADRWQCTDHNLATPPVARSRPTPQVEIQHQTGSLDIRSSHRLKHFWAVDCFYLLAEAADGDASLLFRLVIERKI
jgi:hypothetical protein